MKQESFIKFSLHEKIVRTQIYSLDNRYILSSACSFYIKNSI